MTNAIVAFIQGLFFLWLLEKILKAKLIRPALKYGKLAVEWALSGLTAAISAAVALAGFIVRQTPAAIAWVRSIRR